MKIFTHERPDLLFCGNNSTGKFSGGKQLFKTILFFIVFMFSSGIVFGQLSIDNVFQTNPTGCSNSDGQIVILASGGTAPLEYSIDGGLTYVSVGPNPNIFTGLTGGEYNVQVKDALGTIETWVANPIVLYNADGISVQGSNTVDASCFSEADGSLQVVVDYGNSGPTSPFTFELFLGAVSQGTNTTGEFTGISAGTYSVEITNDACTETVSGLVVGEPAEIQIAISEVDASCNGDNNGSITAVASDGTPPYLYVLKDNGNNIVGSNATGIFTGLAGGNYTVEVTDSEPCSNSAPATVGNPSALSIDLVSSNDISCFGNSDGTIDVTVSGGTAPYTYYLNRGDASEQSNLTGNFSGLAQGDYNVSIEDANSCTLIYSGNPVTINEPAQLTIGSVTPTDVTGCNGDATGSIAITATGGTSPLSYSIDNGGSWQLGSGTFNGLTAGTYNIMVRDDNMCSVSYGSNPVTISEPTVVSITNVSGNDETCTGAADGDVTITASGGTGDLFYSVVLQGNPPSYGAAGVNTVSGLNAGTYDVQVKDANDCATAVQSITLNVADNTPPTAICQNITVQLDAAGNVSITANDIDNGSSDNCAISSMTLNQYDFNCTHVGANNVTLTVEDSNGNTDNCVATVTIQDNVDPTPVCQNITIQLDGTGNANIVAADIDGGSSDNCGVASISASQTAFNCAHVGPNAVTLTVTDVNGNTATCVATVTVEDIQDPVAVCSNTTIQLDASGNASITANDIDGGSSDNCGFSLATSKTSFTCSDLGSNSVTLTVTDDSGNTDFCVATVTVEDNIAPVAVCTDATIFVDGSGNATLSTGDIDNGSSDNCGIANMSLSQTVFNCGDIGAPIAVTLTVEDAAGNTDFCVANVTIEDNTDPVANCKNITIQLDGSGNASIVAADVDNTSTDNCGIASMSVSPSSFTCANIGPNTVTLTVTDDSGNTNTCLSTVTVEDDINPVAICSNTTIQLDASGNASITANDIDGGSSDNCNIATMVASQTSFDCSNIGANSVTLTVTDDAGNSDFCIATVTVEDNIAPVASCQNFTLELDASGNGTLLASDIDNGSSDNCTLNYSLSQTAFDCSDIGSPVTVTLTVTDPGGNSDNCTATVTVLDNMSPNAVCQNATIQLDASGNASLDPADIDNGSTDNCGVLFMTVTPNGFGCLDVGDHTVTLTVYDANFNSSTCTATVTVQDPIAPTAVCQNISVDLDASGFASISASDLDGGSTDNCAISFSASQVLFDCTDLGANNVTLTVTDDGGNTDQCVSVVTVNDPISPVAVCQNIDVYLDASGNATITANQLDGGSSDNCTLSFSASQTAFNCADVGTNSVTLTATDGAGNTDDCVATVTVHDEVAPNAICQNVTIFLDASGNASTSATAVNNGSTDACGIASLSLDQTAFNCADMGPNTVTLTVTDVNGNTATCTATVTVEDNLAPTASCSPYTAQLDASGSVTISGSDVDGGSSDNCGVASLDVSPNTFGCADVGLNVVTLTVTDNNGNTASCTTNVTVEDNVNPTASCMSYMAELDASGNATVIPADIDNGSSDNCGIASMTINGGASVTYTCADIGNHTVTLEVTDVNGNSASCTANVDVVDNIDPTALCSPFTAQLDASGSVTITGANVDGGSSDNCGVASLDVSPSTFGCADVGSNTVTLTVTDNSGNTATCTTTVTVEDNINPTASCVAGPVDVYLDASGNAVITANDIDNGSSDNCGIANMSVDITTFNCGDIVASPIAVTLTVTDDSGNSDFCISSVNVIDNVNPDVLCMDYTAELDASGNVTVTPANIDNGSSDNCGIASMTINGAPSVSYTCADLGSHTVTLEVTDVNGNSANCTANVTVVDNIDPLASCSPYTAQLDASGSVTITGANVDGGSTDNCSVASLNVSPATFTCANIGPNTVTLTVTDNSGNTATCTTTVTVEDNLNPDVQCIANPTIELDATGNKFITPANIDNGSSDNCGIATMALSKQLFTCADVGPVSITLTVTDVNGNSDFCIANATVVDNTAPNAICKDITIDLDVTGNATITGNDIDDNSTDACGIASVSASPNSFDCNDVGPNTVTLTVTDVNGNTSTCLSTVTVQDVQNPTAVCSNITIQLDASGNASITAADIDGGSNDNCNFNLSASQTSFDCSNIGANNVTLTVTDDSGNSDNCVAVVTVEDNINPNAICQNFTAELDATGNVLVLPSDVDGGSSDNCGIASMTINGGASISYNCADIGTHTVTLEVTDNNSNSSNCTATITVVDNVKPVVTCPSDDEIFIGAGCQVILPDYSGSLSASDACGIASAIQNPAAGTVYTSADAGPNTIEFTVTDVNGNIETCSFTVTVTDALAFTIDNVDVTDISCNGLTDGEISITATGGGAGNLYYSIDNGATFGAANVSTFSGLSAGNYDIVVKNDNDCEVAYSGNSVTITEPAALMIIAVLHQPPLCNGGNDGEILILATGGHGTYEYSIDNGSTWQSSNIFTDLTAGFYDVWIRDAAYPTCDMYYGVPYEVTEPPALQIDNVIISDVTCFGDTDGAITINASGGSGDLYFSVGPVGDAPVYGLANDNFFDNLAAGDYDIYVSDDHSCELGPIMYTIGVGDNINPTVICQDISVSLDASGNATITASDIDNGSFDNCAIVDLSVTPSSFTCANLGANNVTLTAEDSNGNTASCIAVVTIIDDIAPTFTAPADITIFRDASCMYDASVTITGDVTDEADNCSVGEATYSDAVNNTDPCSVIITRTWSLIDDEGNPAADQVQTITIEDNTAPTFTAPVDITIYKDASCMYDADVAFTGDVTDEADNCGVGEATYSDAVDNSDPCAIVITRTWSLSDDCGNAALDQIQTITVEDNTDPVAVCQNISIDLDANGMASIVPSDIDGGSSDNCGFTLSASMLNFDCSHVGNNNVTLTVTDDCGNAVSCVAVVTVKDITAPDITCPTDQDLFIGSGCEIALPDYSGMLIANDACGIATVVQNPAAGTIYSGADVGPHTIQFTVTDVNGNVSNCSFTVNVSDQEAFTIDDVLFTDVLCNGGNDGTITVLTTGAPSGLFFSIDGIDYTNTSGVFTGLAPGIYTVSAKNINDCMVTYSPDITITEPTPLVIDDVIATNVTGCAGNTNASIEIMASGGTPTYEYSIDNQVSWSSSNLFDDLAAGSYDIFVRDANACVTGWGTTINVNEPAPVLLVDIDVVHITGCYGDLTGEIYIEAAGGTGTLSYSIDGGITFFENNGDFTGLAAGFYDIVIVDENGCDYIAPSPIVITQPAQLVVNDVMVTDVTECYGNNNGAIDVSAMGGTGTILYSIDGGSTFIDNGGLFENLAGGSYNVFITDDNGCIGEYAMNPVILEQPVQITMTVTSGNVSGCAGNMDGFVSINAGGGSGIYTYSIDGGTTWSNSADFTGLAAGSYEVWTQDDLGCMQPYSANPVVLTEPDPIVFDEVIVTDLDCFGAGNGEIFIDAMGGTGILMYSIDGGVTYQTNSNFTELAAGEYNLFIMDENACELAYQNNPVMVSQPNEIIVSNVEVVNESCSGTLGSITITASGGSGNLMYSIDNGNTYQTSNFFANVPADTYVVKVKDGDACEEFYPGNPIVVLDLNPSTVVINADPGTEACTGSNVELTANAFEAVSYTWSTGQTGPSIVVSEAIDGTYDYTCVVVNEDGCESQETISIDFIAGSEITITVDPEQGPYCINDPVELHASADDALSFLWQPGGFEDPTIVVTSDTPGTVEYSVTVINSIGCETTQSIEIDYEICSNVTELDSDIMSINVYPNPSSGEFSLELIGISQDVEISVIDFAGRLVLEEKITDLATQKIEKLFNLTEHERGVYFLRITHGGKVSYKKVVIQ